MNPRNRILIVDDTYEIHEDFRKILRPRDVLMNHPGLRELEEELFDEPHLALPEAEQLSYRIDSAYQGLQAVEMVRQSLEEDDPYVLVFMDVRMPPGINGIETIERIWSIHPKCEMVIVTAYSDYSWEQIIKRVGVTDHLLFLKKPFDQISIKQMAFSLTRKYRLMTEIQGQLEGEGSLLPQRHIQIKRMLADMGDL